MSFGDYNDDWTMYRNEWIETGERYEKLLYADYFYLPNEEIRGLEWVRTTILERMLDKDIDAERMSEVMESFNQIVKDLKLLLVNGGYARRAADRGYGDFVTVGKEITPEDLEVLLRTDESIDTQRIKTQIHAKKPMFEYYAVEEVYEPQGYKLFEKIEGEPSIRTLQRVGRWIMHGYIIKAQYLKHNLLDVVDCLPMPNWCLGPEIVAELLSKEA